MKWLIISLLLFSCSPQKRLNKILDRNPEFKQVDTLTILDTIYTDNVRLDTVFDIDSLHDTIIVERDKLRIKTVFRDNKIYVEGECESDTVFFERKIPVEKIIYVEDSFWTDVKKFFRKSWRILIMLVVVAVGVRLAKKFGL